MGVIKSFINGTLSVSYKCKKRLDEKIDNYYEEKESSSVDPVTNGRVYPVQTFSSIDESNNIGMVVFLSTSEQSFPRVDYYHSQEDDRNVFIIIPESFYRRLSFIEKYAMLSFLLTEAACIFEGFCLYEEDKKTIDRQCKVFPDLLAGRINEMIDFKVEKYNEIKERENKSPQIYSSEL